MNSNTSQPTGKKASDTVFNGFNRSENFALSERFPYGGHVYKDDIAQLALGKIGNPYIGFIAFDPNPFVIFRVLQVGWNVHRLWF